MSMGDPGPKRLPVGFDGPVCAKCKHARPVFDKADRRNWRCDGVEPTLIYEASLDAVTGEIHPALHRVVDCDDQNRDGDCEIFEPATDTNVEASVDALQEHERDAAQMGVTVSANPYAGPAGRALRMAEVHKAQADDWGDILAACPWWRLRAKRRIRALMAGCIEEAIRWTKESARLDGEASP
jgi:hypothetical protein